MNSLPVLSRKKRVEKSRRKRFIPSKRKRIDSDINEQEARDLLALLTLLAARNDLANNDGLDALNIVDDQPDDAFDNSYNSIPYTKSVVFGNPRNDVRDEYVYERQPQSSFARSRSRGLEAPLSRLRPSLGFQAFSNSDLDRDRDDVPLYSLSDLLAAGYGREAAMKRRKRSIVTAHKKWKSFS